ncbi:hypothetical protein ACFYXS_05015 [Streptomyces sp. NPDC002574]|uniref:hypothetical protein n=1 Tax=Streptomyces sp. NPDC002574 TaxID=3364652 RepID=UPI0036988112
MPDDVLTLGVLGTWASTTKQAWAFFGRRMPGLRSSARVTAEQPGSRAHCLSAARALVAAGRCRAGPLTGYGDGGTIRHDWTSRWGWGMAGKPVEDVERYCRRCEQRVPPVVNKKAGEDSGILATTQVGALVVAVVNVFHQLGYPPPLPWIPRLSLVTTWPAAVRPAWLGLVVAMAVFVGSAIFSLEAKARAQRSATCPICLLRFDAE